MKYSSQHVLLTRTLVVGISIAFLSGCAAAPGMYMDEGNATVEPVKGSPSVNPIIKTITPQLIQEEQQLAKTATQVDLSEIMTPPQPYKIGPGDYLAITVWDHPELVMPTISMTGTSVVGVMAAMGSLPAGTLPPGYTVSSEGKIQFPYAGDFKVEGLTEEQARDLLVQRLVCLYQKAGSDPQGIRLSQQARVYRR